MELSLSQLSDSKRVPSLIAKSRGIQALDDGIRQLRCDELRGDRLKRQVKLGPCRIATQFFDQRPPVCRLIGPVVASKTHNDYLFDKRSQGLRQVGGVVTQHPQQRAE